MGKIHKRLIEDVGYDKSNLEKINGLFDGFDLVCKNAPLVSMHELIDLTNGTSNRDLELRLDLGNSVSLVSLSERTANGFYIGTIDYDDDPLRYLEIDPEYQVLDSNCAAFRLGTIAGRGMLDVHYFDPLSSGGQYEVELFESTKFFKYK